ncbi:Crp/Fnr family transcriptional regulator [Paucilactobacillus nenjiangensis]|jgi:CRP/FNR family transcriptional regulator|uniref:Crp/Fnr family transcriptional regulator n=1 Tax=Paucilactobacillus nenjiangensis TaxID=1296540 RepID=A0A5P1X0P2_9LACO|nr:Crp/Fnr family transcriptional regulator [Paucilactobacillus nenjiangensis]QER66444.1 Crp/Fnr family transcriptional regulator [Paucilactobacillus nenjiangensis]
MLKEDHLCVTLVPLFDVLDVEDQKRINDLVSHRTLSKGEVVIDPNEEAQLVIVARGDLKIYQLSANGHEQLMRIAEPGDYEGESALLGAHNENVYGEALEKTEVCILKHSDFHDLLESYPELALKLLSINADKMKQIEQQSQFLTMEKVEERLANYLLNLNKVADDENVVIPMKMKDLATFLGTTPETLSRKLKLLEQKKLIKKNHKQVRLLDIDALEDV